VGTNCHPPWLKTSGFQESKRAAQKGGEVAGTARKDLERKHIPVWDRSRALRAVKIEMVARYWQIGRLIVEEDQRGETQAAYGEGLIKELSGKLVKVSEGFSRIGYNFQ